jgi:hypothetical protein
MHEVDAPADCVVSPLASAMTGAALPVDGSVVKSALQRYLLRAAPPSAAP